MWLKPQNPMMFYFPCCDNLLISSLSRILGNNWELWWISVALGSQLPFSDFQKLWASSHKIHCYSQALHNVTEYHRLFNLCLNYEAVDCVQNSLTRVQNRLETGWAVSIYTTCQELWRKLSGNQKIQHWWCCNISSLQEYVFRVFS